MPVAVSDFRIEGIEADGPEVPIKKREICDFCPAKNPSRVFRAYDCVVPWVPVEDGTIVLSQGGWAACEVCAALIDGGKWAELIERSVREFCAKNFVFDLRLIAGVRDQVRRSHELFRDHRIIGPGELVTNLSHGSGGNSESVEKKAD